MSAPATDPAAGLHARLFTIDTHSDTPTHSLGKDGWDFAARHDRATDRSQVDLPRMRGAVDAMVFAVYVGQMSRSADGLGAAHELALTHFARTHATLEKHRAECGLALTPDDAIRLKAEGRRALFLSIENSYSLGRDPANVEKFHRLGVRMLGLTHMLNNDVADASTDPRGPEWGGLSPLGREIVAECNRLGIVLDASHASDDALRDLLNLSRAPVILSHSGCRAVCDHPRNIGDDLLRALAAKGGVLSLVALPLALAPAADPRQAAAMSEMLLKMADAVIGPEVLAWSAGEWERIERTFSRLQASRDDFIRHLEHAVAVAGIDHVGVGCDFDGGGGVTGLDQVSDFPHLTGALLARGWRESDLAKLWGGNVLRVMRAAK